MYIRISQLALNMIETYLRFLRFLQATDNFSFSIFFVYIF